MRNIIFVQLYNFRWFRSFRVLKKVLCVTYVYNSFVFKIIAVTEIE